MRTAMRYATVAGTALVATISGVGAQGCAPGSAKEIGGNWYCNAVKHITYSDFGSTGSFNKVTSMDDGNCKTEPFDYSGALAPLDGEVSWNFRGPLNLKQFAFYTPGSSPEKRDTKLGPHQRRSHNHAPFHQHDEQKRAIDDFVTITFDSHAASWVNEYGKGGPQTAAPAAPAASQASDQPFDKGTLQEAGPTLNAGNGQWGRQAYYNAEQQMADGLVFLNNKGGQGSGVFDETLGMSLSYASADGKSGSASPEILVNETLGDGDEIVIMTDKACTDGGCGVTRPGGVAYHGFDGAKKVFLVEFDMPLTGSQGWNQDMPAAWILNAAIPNTIQYGRSECSCWESGCGEWDIFEVLDPGNIRCKSTVHGNVAGGDSNYFARPVDETVKVAVVFDPDHNSGHIVVLPHDTAFDATITDEQLAAFVDKESLAGDKSLFRLGS